MFNNGLINITECFVLSEVKSADCILLSFTVGADQRMRPHIVSLLAVYLLNSCSVHQFVGDIEHIIKNKQINDNCIFLGDLSVDVLSETGVVHDYFHFLSNYGFTSLVNESTKIVYNSKTCLDHVFDRFTRNVISNSKANVLHTNLTDHSTVIPYFSFSKCNFKNISPKFPAKKTKFNFDKLSDIVSKVVRLTFTLKEIMHPPPLHCF